MGERPRRCLTPCPQGPRVAEHWFESQPLWFKTAVFYEIHTRAFFDSQRRRLGRLPRPHAEARLPAVARHRLHLAAAVLPVAASRRRLRHRRLLRHQPGLRRRRGLPALRRGGARARDPRDRRPRHEPHVVGPPVVPGVAERSERREGDWYVWSDSDDRVPGRPDHLHRHRDLELDAGTPSAASTTGTASSTTSRT